MKKILALSILILIAAGCSPKIDNFPDGKEINLICDREESAIEEERERNKLINQYSDNYILPDYYYKFCLIKGSNQNCFKTRDLKVGWQNLSIVITYERSPVKFLTRIDKDDLTFKRTHYYKGKVSSSEAGSCEMN